MVSYESFKKVFDILEGEPEIEVFFKNTNNTYMIIKYRDRVTIAKVADELNRGEIKYKTLDELYNSTTIDGINLKNDWNNIKDIIIDEIYSFVDDKDEIERLYNIVLEDIK